MATSSERRTFDKYLAPVRGCVDVEAIRDEWLSLGHALCIQDRHMPLPVWARRPFCETGAQAWTRLCERVPLIAEASPLSIYVHIPYCAHRCAFCDCYSFPVRRQRALVCARYVDLLIQEMDSWAKLGSLPRRPVTTVHLGGGTPTFLDPASLQRLVAACIGRFCITQETEWALESTSSELTDEMLLLLEDLGFRRLHLGVQTLRDRVRERLGRREPAHTVLAKLARAVQRGWITSVDLIVGLPGQTASDIVADIASLTGIGVEGFSVYELQTSGRNRRFAEQHGPLDQHGLVSYLGFQTALQALVAQRYRKTLFNHLARERDANLYFTFPERGEDLLALGSIADGAFGDYHYRHPEHVAYVQGVRSGSPGLQGGLERNAMENQQHPLEIALLSGTIAQSLFTATLGQGTAQALLSSWEAVALVRATEEGEDRLGLTGNGSWFVGNMMAELIERLCPREGGDTQYRRMHTTDGRQCGGGSM